MSEMTQSQLPPGGDENPDPSTEIVPPAARSPRDPTSFDEGSQTPPREGSDTGAQGRAQEGDDSSRPAVVLPGEEDMPSSADQDLGEEGGSDTQGPSDPMPDIAGGESSPTT
jgi:hypothetical protein